jgi:hypothetical protein
MVSIIAGEDEWDSGPGVGLSRITHVREGLISLGSFGAMLVKSGIWSRIVKKSLDYRSRGRAL